MMEPGRTSMTRTLFSKGNKVQYSSFELALRDLEESGYELWFHGTTTISARSIQRRISLERGRTPDEKRRDFSFGHAFYLCSEAAYARAYCQHRHEGPVSVIVFRLPSRFFRQWEEMGFSGLNLFFPYRVLRYRRCTEGEETAESETENEPDMRCNLELVEPTHTEKQAVAEKVVSYYLGQIEPNSEDHEWITSNSVDDKDFIVGPVSDRSSGPRLRYPPADGYQLCIKNQGLADVLHECIVHIVDFKHENADGQRGRHNSY